MRVLVTGIAGFISSHVGEQLVKLGHDVTGLDNLSAGKLENLPVGAKFIKGDICDDLKSLFEEGRFDAVIHLAACPSVPFSIKYPATTFKDTIGTINLLNACKEHGVKRFVFSSSCSVYGEQKTMPLVETMEPHPISSYALGKYVCEQYMNLFHKLYGIETIALRYFNVYGPRQSSQGYACVVPKFAELIKLGMAPIINGDGTQTRDLIYVSDVVEANVLALETKNEKCFGEVFNIGTGHSISVNEIAQSLIKILDKPEVKPLHGPPVLEPHDAKAGVSKVWANLGWKSQVSFEEGLKEMFIKTDSEL